MSATYGATWSGQTAASTRRIFIFFKRYWDAFSGTAQTREIANHLVRPE
jgi:hypothetical protein